MIGPFDEVKAGGQLSAAEMNRMFRELVRMGRLKVAPPLQLTEDWQGRKLFLNLAPAMFVRITGHVTSGTGSGGAQPSYFYSGIQQWSYTDGTVEDAPTGIHFYANLTPLVEMEENASVAVGAIVLAIPAASGDHYEFLATSGGGGSSTVPQGCHCCCCCVPCNCGGIWLQIGQFYLNGCGLPADTQGFTVPLAYNSGDGCYEGSVTQDNPGGFGGGTVTATFKVCCDQNDLRKCAVLKVVGVTTIPSGDFAGTYHWCIGPIDINSTVLNCPPTQADPVYEGEGAHAAINWSANLNTADWGCDPNTYACQCPVTPFAGASITIECLCRSCPISCMPNSMSVVFNCTTPSGDFTQTFTITYMSDLSGTPCGGSYGQPGWYGESDDDGNGCRVGFALQCLPSNDVSGGEFAYCVATIADEGGDCTNLNDIISSCVNLPGQSSTICCDPFGIIVKNSAPATIITIGNPSAPCV